LVFLRTAVSKSPFKRFRWRDLNRGLLITEFVGKERKEPYFYPPNRVNNFEPMTTLRKCFLHAEQFCH